MGKSGLESALAFQIRALQLSPEIEYSFHPKRKWRFDFAFPEQKVGIEVEGGVWTRGRHTRPVGFIKDCEKYNEAALLGWKVLRFAEPHIVSGEAISTIERAVKA